MGQGHARKHRNGKLRLASIRESIAARLWPLPVAAIVVAVTLGVAIPVIDSLVDERLAPFWAAALFSGGSAAARAVLSAIASSLVAATTLTFSLTVVALQLGSTQASPRVLRMFARDPVVHRTLAVFLGTFAFALTVLRSVKDATDPDPAVVPRIAVTVAFLLTLVSVVMLVLFLSHLARQLRIETVLRNVHDETNTTIGLVTESADEAERPSEVPRRPRTARPILSRRSGFITTIDRQRLVKVAAEHDLVVQEARTIGSDVVKATPLGFWWPRESGHEAEHDGESESAESITGDLHGAFTLGYERTPTQDVGFGLRQLVDIAVRALSPGTNDPTTAVHTLGHISAVLGALAMRPNQPLVWTDQESIGRVVVCTHDFAELTELAVSQIRRYGSGDPDVVARLYLLLRELAWVCRGDEQRAVVRSQVQRLDASVAERDHDEVERERFAEMSDAAGDALAGHWR